MRTNPFGLHGRPPLPKLAAICALVVLTLTKVVAGYDNSPDPFEKTPRLQSTPVADVRQKLLAWLDEIEAPPVVR